MLQATKGTITLLLSIKDGKVCIIPQMQGEEYSRLLATIARNEELLAQIDISQTALTHSYEQLKGYFSNKGWLVTEGLLP